MTWLSHHTTIGKIETALLNAEHDASQESIEKAKTIGVVMNTKSSPDLKFKVTNSTEFLIKKHTSAYAETT